MVTNETVDSVVHIVADREVCIGAGQCVLAAPHLFDQDEEDGRVMVVAEPTSADTPTVVEAARVCPSRAISWTH